MNHFEIDTVIDGGANKGQWIDMVRKDYLKAAYIVIEPIPEHLKEVREKYFGKENLEFFEIALSSRPGTSRLNLASNNGASSSLQQPRAILKTLPQIKFMDSIIVKTETLNNLRNWDESKSIYLKLDLQGHEFEALIGASKLLKKIKIIEIESSFSPLYEDEIPFHKIFEFLTDSGFEHYQSSPARIDLNGKQWDFNSFFISGGYNKI